LEPITRDYRRIKKKRENLDDVIKYEDIAVRYDSILRLAHMSEGDRLAFFTEYTTGLREKAVRDSIANAQQKETLANNEFFKPGNTIGKTNEEKKKQGGRFYFYNPTSVGYGRQAFRSNWGDRKLEDYWRLSSIQKSKVSGATVSVFKEGNVSRLYDPAAYAAKIPTGPKVIDSLTKDRNFAYYQLGLIYKEKFKEYTLAVNRLEKLLTYKPEERLLLPAKYNLYKIYAQQGNETLAAQLKNDILTNHAGTRYAEIVANPILLLEHGEGSPEYNYTQLYREFEQARYANVINRADGYIAQYNGTEHVPKFEMLKATAMGRQQGIAAYKKALNYVALNYPSTYEGEEAQKIYSTVIPNLEALKFTPDADVVGEWKIVYTFPTAQREAAKTLRAKIEEALKQYRYETNKTSLDHYSLEILFVVIHGFKSQSGARGAAHLLRGNKGNTITRDYFEIATPNYKVVQLHKNLEGYLNRPTTVGTNQEPQK
ncbi:MAG: tetratricopeptide repeat protein, partial [Marinirhabdus sp.]